jgi:plastocyanin
MRPGRFAFFAIVLGGIATVPAQSATIDVVMQNLVVKPVEVTAKVGDTIRWDNKDFVAHTATATGGAFDVMLPAGKSGSTIVTKAGTFDYICKFHPNMKGKVTVTP